MTAQAAPQQSALQGMTEAWLAKRGHAISGFLSKQQKQDFHECFSMLDADKTGRVSIDNLLAAFQLLSIEVHSSDVRELVAAVDRRGFGSITYEDFEAVMAASMLQTASPADDTPSLSSTVRLSPSAGSMPFHEIARAFRRKQMMAEIMGSNKSRQQLLNRHADRYTNDESHGRSLMAVRLHLEEERLREARSRPKRKAEAPSKPQVAVIRLRDIAKHLPPPIRDAVAEAVAYDPPTPHKSADNHADLSGQQSQQQQPQQQPQQQQQPQLSPNDAQQHPLDAAVPSVSHDAAWQSLSAESGHTQTASVAAQGPKGTSQQAEAATINMGSAVLQACNAAHNAAASVSNTGVKVDRGSEEAYVSKSHAGLRLLLALPAKQAQHGKGSADSAAPVWRNPAEMTPREAALEKLLIIKLSQGVPDKEGPVSSGGAQHAGQKAVSFGQASTALKRKTISAQPTKRTSSAIVPALPLATVLPESQENAEQGEDIVHALPVGDDGLPVGVFERHSLSPMKTAALPVTHQQHLDSFRLIELRTFRQHQQQQQANNVSKEKNGFETHFVTDTNQAEQMAQCSALQQQSPDSSASVQLAAAAVPLGTGALHSNTSTLPLHNSALPASQSSLQLHSMHKLHSTAGRRHTADAAVQSMFRTSSRQPELALQQANTAPAAKSLTSNPAFSIPTTVSLLKQPHSILTGNQEADIASTQAYASQALLQTQYTADRASGKNLRQCRVSGNAERSAAVAGGKPGFVENLWAGIGGFGRNGRGKAPKSAAALQTPRPAIPTSRVSSSRQQSVPLPSIARHLWQDNLQQGSQAAGSVQGSAGALNAAALLNIAGQTCEAAVPRLIAARAAVGKHGLMLWEAAC